MGKKGDAGNHSPNWTKWKIRVLQFRTLKFHIGIIIIINIIIVIIIGLFLKREKKSAHLIFSPHSIEWMEKLQYTDNNLSFNSNKKFRIDI